MTQKATRASAYNKVFFPVEEEFSANMLSNQNAEKQASPRSCVLGLSLQPAAEAATVIPKVRKT